MSRPIFLLTDFGAEGHYHGVMKGVIETCLPGASCIDLGHGIRPGAVREAAYVLEASLDHLPPDAVVVAVVDPGVGSERSILLLEVEGRVLVAPDNGLLTRWVDAAEGAHHLDLAALGVDPGRISSTFHGRDLFAPAAARIAGGTAPATLGSPCAAPRRLSRLDPDVRSDLVVGEVVHVDRFGNLISNVPAECLEGMAAPVVEVAGRRLTFSRTFSDVAPGELLAYLGSSGHVEVAVRDGDAAARLAMTPGAALRVHPSAD